MIRAPSPRRIRRALAACVAVAAIAAGPLCGVARATPDTRVPEPGAGEPLPPPRVLAFGDVHGCVDPVVQLLVAADVLDDDRRWVGGEAHVVFVGDILDRGVEERALLDFLMRLEHEAAEAGGRVWVLLGNHEIMSLVRDLRYVDPRAYAAFVDLESEADREDAWRRYREDARRGGSKRSERKLREVFEAAHPPGYFGRLRALEPDGVYGRWLADRPVVAKIGEIAFVHGGLTPEVAVLGIDAINDGARHAVRRFWKSRDVLVAAELLSPFANFEQTMQVAGALRGRELERDVRRAATALRSYLGSLVASPDGPVWYRGNSVEDERLERGALEEALDAIGAQRLVVGHSITHTGRISCRFDGALFRTDVGLVHGGDASALLIEEGAFRILEADGDVTDVPHEPPGGEAWPAESGVVPETGLEQFLEAARIRGYRQLGRGSTRPYIVVLESDALARRAIFKNVTSGGGESGGDRWEHEVAAYRLDRLLGFGMVPITVERQLEGLGTGSLQWWVSGAIDGLDAKRYELPEALLASRDFLLARMRVFDLLIGNGEREDSDILYVPAARKIMIVDHSAAFGVEVVLDEDGSGSAGCILDRDAHRALLALDRDVLATHLGAWIPDDAIDALLARRDRLVESCARAEEKRSARVRVGG